LYAGNFTEATAWIEKALATSKSPDVPASVPAELKALLGIIALRCGEVENCLGCVGPSSCIFPIAREAVHRNQEGSREAVRWFMSYLQDQPGDLRVIWLLDIASMTLGEYPDKVPTRFQIPLDLFASKVDVGRFKNVAMKAGLGSRGPNLAGGSIFDDFNGDGLPDLFTSCIDADRGASLYINRGDGTFDDHFTKAGIDDQIYSLNVTRADYDNDSDLDVLLLRGAWEFPARLSLLRNRGDGTFDDVTIASGLGEPIASEVAAWGDYDNDGRPDLFVGGEYIPPFGDPAASPRDPPTGADCTTTRAMGHLLRSLQRPASATSAAPKGQRGAITTMMAGSISSSRICARNAGFITIEETALLWTLPASLA
jgi:hypothetical protein